MAQKFDETHCPNVSIWNEIDYESGLLGLASNLSIQTFQRHVAGKVHKFDQTTEHISKKSTQTLQLEMNGSKNNFKQSSTLQKPTRSYYAHLSRFYSKTVLPDFMESKIRRKIMGFYR